MLHQFRRFEYDSMVKEINIWKTAFYGQKPDITYPVSDIHRNNESMYKIYCVEYYTKDEDPIFRRIFLGKLLSWK